MRRVCGGEASSQSTSSWWVSGDGTGGWWRRAAPTTKIKLELSVAWNCRLAAPPRVNIATQGSSHPGNLRVTRLQTIAAVLSDYVAPLLLAGRTSRWCSVRSAPTGLADWQSLLVGPRRSRRSFRHVGHRGDRTGRGKRATEAQHSEPICPPRQWGREWRWDLHTVCPPSLPQKLLQKLHEETRSAPAHD